MIETQKYFEWLETIIKVDVLGSPPLKLENEYLENQNDLKTIIDYTIERSGRRAIQLLFEYRPRVRIVETTATKGEILITKEDLQSIGIRSEHDIYEVYPEKGGVVRFPMAPFVSPTGRLVFYGVFHYADLGVFLAGLQTFLNTFGGQVTWSIFYDNNNNMIIKIFPTYLGEGRVILVVRVNPEMIDLQNATIRELKLNQIELELITKFVKSQVLYSLGRIRKRFGGELPLGVGSISLDGDDLISEAKELEKEFYENLIQYGYPTLPSWG